MDLSALTRMCSFGPPLSVPPATMPHRRLLCHESLGQGILGQYSYVLRLSAGFLAMFSFGCFACPSFPHLSLTQTLPHLLTPGSFSGVGGFADPLAYKSMRCWIVECGCFGDASGLLGGVLVCFCCRQFLFGLPKEPVGNRR